MNKIGLHIHSLQPEVYQALIRLMPRGAIIMNPTPEWIEDIRAVMGSNFYLAVRKYEAACHSGRDRRRIGQIA